MNAYPLGWWYSGNWYMDFGLISLIFLSVLGYNEVMDMGI